jgi:hypothetical protein
VQAKGTENIFNKIIAENIPNIENEIVIQAWGIWDTQQTMPFQDIIVKPLKTQNQEKY